MGAASFSNRRDVTTADGRRGVEATVTLSNSYATGGESVSLTSLGMDEVRRVEIIDPGASGYVVKGDVADPNAPKLVVERRADAGTVAEPAAATDVSVVNDAKLRFVGS